MLAALAALFAFPAAAHATFPGANGKIVFARSGDIWTMNADGSDQLQLTSTPVPQVEFTPRWSPDGTRIVYALRNTSNGATQIHFMNADGSGDQVLGNGVTPDRDPGWSPDGARIAFFLQKDMYVMNTDNTGRTLLAQVPDIPSTLDWSPDGRSIAFSTACTTSGGAYVGTLRPEPGTTLTPVTSVTTCGISTGYADKHPSWSPDAQRILFARWNQSGPVGLYTIKPNGQELQPVIFDSAATDPVWSPDGTRIVFSTPATFCCPENSMVRVMNADGTGAVDLAVGRWPDWQPLPITAYPRPRGATPFRMSLVPAYTQCTAPNRTHGTPLSFGSCNPPSQSSGQLTLGTPDANGKGANSQGSVLYGVVPGNSTTPADVGVVVSISDVRKKSDLSDYTGQLQVSSELRITDKDNSPAPGGPGAGTAQDAPLPVTVSCTATASDTTGSSCNLSTSFDALIPGVAKAGMRAIWQLDHTRVYDGGADGLASTQGDNTLFMTQGVFVP